MFSWRSSDVFLANLIAAEQNSVIYAGSAVKGRALISVSDKQGLTDLAKVGFCCWRSYMN